MHDGRRRDTIYYSILRAEWENIKHTILVTFSHIKPAQSNKP
jgi:N-acetyltransferase